MSELTYFLDPSLYLLTTCNHVCNTCGFPIADAEASPGRTVLKRDLVAVKYQDRRSRL